MNKLDFLTMAFENNTVYTNKQAEILDLIRKEITDPHNITSGRMFAQSTMRLLAEFLFQTSGADIVETDNNPGTTVYVA